MIFMKFGSVVGCVPSFKLAKKRRLTISEFWIKLALLHEKIKQNRLMH